MKRLTALARRQNEGGYLPQATTPGRIITLAAALLMCVPAFHTVAQDQPDRAGSAASHTVLTPWGTLAGMRVEGGWVEFEAGMRVVRPDWSGFSSAVKYLQRPRYSRAGDRQTVTSAIEDLEFSLRLQDRHPGEAELDVAFTVPRTLAAAGVFFCLEVPAREFSGGFADVRKGEDTVRTGLTENAPAGRSDYFQGQGRALHLIGQRQRIEIGWPKDLEVRIRRDASDHPTVLNDPKVAQRFVKSSDVRTPPFQVYLKLAGPDALPEERVSLRLSLKASVVADYLVFLKDPFGVEAILFSFNEPETGVEVRQTPDEHAQFVKAMGAELKQRGLKTKMLLGDTAHGTPAALRFIGPTLADADARAHVGAVGFHTWRGCTGDALRQWSDAARRLGVPLLVTEAGPDAHLHEYPAVRLEPWFQLQEIDLYLRVCAHAQPATIMEWQLTTDYAILSGGGVYGESGLLKPTQRFWNLKQLGATPARAFALPVTADRPEITVAAFGDPANDRYAVHIVNWGNHRPAVLSGLPESVSALRRFVTDATRGMEETGRVEVRRGKAEFILSPASYTTLLSGHPMRPAN